MPQKVRDILGFGSDEAVDDRELEVLIRVAQEQVKRELFIFHFNEEVLEHPYTGASWDGNNVTFQTMVYPIMDDNLDYSVTASDISVRWLSNTYEPSTASWSVKSAVWGLVNIYQSDGVTAIPGNAETVRIDYWARDKNITNRQLDDLTAYLTAHLVQGRMTSGTSISLADFQANRPLILKHESQFLMKYKMLLHNLQGDIVKGV